MQAASAGWISLTIGFLTHALGQQEFWPFGRRRAGQDGGEWCAEAAQFLLLYRSTICAHKTFDGKNGCLALAEFRQELSDL